MRRSLLVGSLVLLVAPAAAVAGGFATTGLSSTPAGLRAGEPWKVELTILQHGQTPLGGLSPRVVTRDAGGSERNFRATPSGSDGHYTATVTFPKPGSWTYTVYDGFNDAMPTTYPPVRIAPAGVAAPAARTPDPDGPPVLAIALVGALALAAGAFVLARRRRVASGRPRLAPR
jgi:hypothetical protein